MTIMFHQRPLILFVLLTVTTFGRAATAQAVDVVIANRECGFDKIDQESLKSLFLGKKRTLPNGVHANIIIQGSGPANDSFLRDYVGETPSQFQTYWRRLVFTGQGKMPTTVASDAEAIDIVAKDKTALSYIDSATPHDQVKIITVEP